MCEKRYKPCGSDYCCYTNDREYVQQLEQQNKEMLEMLKEWYDYGYNRLENERAIAKIESQKEGG